MPEKEHGEQQNTDGPDILSDAEIEKLLGDTDDISDVPEMSDKELSDFMDGITAAEQPETRRSEENKPETPDVSAEEDRVDVLNQTLREALQTYRESLATDGDPETAKSKAVRKIYEVTTGEYDHLIPDAIGKFMAGLEKGTVRAESIEEIQKDVGRLNELVRETEENAKERIQSALAELENLISEAESKGIDVLKYRFIASNAIPRDYMKDVEGFLSGPHKPVLMTADNFEKYRGQYEEIIGGALAEIEKTKTELTEKMGAEAKSAPAETQPPRQTRREAEGETSEEEKDAIVQTTLDVFKQELGISSVSAAEEAARNKFKEAAGKLDRKTYEELRQRITQEINSLEAEERKKMKAAETAAETKPETPEPEKPAEVSPSAEKPAPVPPSTGHEGPLRPSNGSKVEENQVEGPAPAELPAEEKPQAAKTETVEAAELPPSSELTAEELEAIFAVADKAEKIEDLPETAKEKLGLGFNNLGFFVEENKNKFFASILEKVASKFDAKGTMGRFVGSLAENSRRDQAKAQEKFEAVKQGGREHLSNISYLGGNLLRYGRLALDATGYSVVAPLRFAMLGAMGFARGAEAAKEARFKNEEVIEKTRVNNLNWAEDEAWEIYEAAQGKAGDAEVASGELKLAFLENLPLDILQRLDEWSPPEKTNAAADIARNLTERWINFSLERVQKKLDQAETEAEKQKILKKYEGKFNDFNRLVGDYGQIDALAMGAKISEGLAKGVRTAMTWESLAELPFSVHKIWSDIAGVLGERGEAPNVPDLIREEVRETTRNDYALKMLGINLEDGCTEAEANEIADEIDRFRSVGKKDTVAAAIDIFGSLKTGDAGRSVAEIIGERREKLVDLYDTVLGIDSKDGLDTDEAVKISSFINESEPEKFDEILDLYGQTEVKGTNQTLENLIKSKVESTPMPEPTPEPIPESAPEPAATIEESPAGPAPETVPTPAPSAVEGPEIKTGRFENTIEPGGDSIWKSTREIFIKNAREFGFDAQRDSSLEKWAETETANAVKELADREYGGKITDLVHAGDRVTIELGADGQPHLRFENLSGREPGYLAERPGVSAPETASSTETVVEAEPETAPEIKTDSAAERLAREYNALPMDTNRDEFVYNYIVTEIEKPAYRALELPDLNHEKLVAFARMFGGGDWAGIDSPEELARTLTEFDDSLNFYTQKLVDGTLDRIFNEGGERSLELTHNVFPIESQDGEIFYAQMQKGGKWRIAASNGDPIELRRPIMRKTDLFDLKNVKKMLGYR